MKAINLLALVLGMCVMTSYVAPAQEVSADPMEETATPKKKKKKKIILYFFCTLERIVKQRSIFIVVQILCFREPQVSVFK